MRIRTAVLFYFIVSFGFLSAQPSESEIIKRIGAPIHKRIVLLDEARYFEMERGADYRPRPLPVLDAEDSEDEVDKALQFIEERYGLKLYKDKTGKVSKIDLATVNRKDWPKALKEGRTFDFEILSHFKDLEELDIRENQLKTLAFLKELKKLKRLNIKGNDLTDLSDLSPLKSLEELRASKNPLEDISGLNALPGLLLLELNEVSVLSKGGALETVSQLRMLRQLNAVACGLDDISALASLNQLESLELGNNRITDMSALSGMSRLKHLSLRYNEIRDLSPAAAMKELNYLDIEGNPLTDVSVLKRLDSLIELNVNGTGFHQLEALKDLKNLKSLVLGRTEITTLPAWVQDWMPQDDLTYIFSESPLKDPPLSVLRQGREALRNYFAQRRPNKGKHPATSFADLQIILRLEKRLGRTLLDRSQGIPPLSQDWYRILCGEDGYVGNPPRSQDWYWILDGEVGYVLDEEMRVIGLSLCRCERLDMNLLRELKSLEYLDLSHTPDMDLGPLQDLPRLRRINLNFSKIRKISPLGKLKSLTHLDLSEAENLVTWPVTQGFKALESLNLSNSGIMDGSGLAGMKNLRELNLSGCPITDLSWLKNLKNLKTLSGVSAVDIAPLSGLNGLERLTLGKGIPDYAPLKELVNLKQLYISDPNFGDLDLGCLRPLRRLNEFKLYTFRGNINVLPEWMVDWNPQLDLAKGLDGNLLIFPPEEVVRRGREVMRRYYSDHRGEMPRLLKIRETLALPRVKVPGNLKYQVLDGSVVKSDRTLLPLKNAGEQMLYPPHDCLAALSPSYPIGMVHSHISSEKYEYSGPCFHKYHTLGGHCVNYYIDKDGQVMTIDSKGKFISLFAPIESKEEALAFVFALNDLGDGEKILYDFDFLQDDHWRIERKLLRPTTVYEADGGYAVILSYESGFGSGFELTAFISRAGEMRLFSHCPLYNDRNTEGIHFD